MEVEPWPPFDKERDDLPFWRRAIQEYEVKAKRCRSQKFGSVADKYEKRARKKKKKNVTK